MYFALLIHSDWEAYRAATPDEVASVRASVDELDRELTEAGRTPGECGCIARSPPRFCGSALGERSPPTAFAETKEQIGGLYLIEAESEDAAVEVAARLSMASLGAVEVRRILGVDLRAPKQHYEDEPAP